MPTQNLRVLTLVLMAILLLGAWYYWSYVYLSPTVSVLENEKICSTDTECILVDTNCCRDCEAFAVSVEFKDKYDSFYKERCEGKSYRSCVPTGRPCLPKRAACEDNICVVKPLSEMPISKKQAELETKPKLKINCKVDTNCKQYISSNTCNLLCANNEEVNNEIISKLETTCDATLWDPPLDRNCSCINSTCITAESNLNVQTSSPPASVENLCSKSGEQKFVTAEGQEHTFRKSAYSVSRCDSGDVWKVIENGGLVPDPATFYFDTNGNLSDICQALFWQSGCKKFESVSCEEKNYCRK